MVKLDNLISVVETCAPQEMNEHMRKVVLIELRLIKEVLAERVKCVPVRQTYTQSGRLARELGLPLEFKKWMLQTFDIDAEPTELPKLTATYIFNEEDEK